MNINYAIIKPLVSGYIAGMLYELISGKRRQILKRMRYATTLREMMVTGCLFGVAAEVFGKFVEKQWHPRVSFCIFGLAVVNSVVVLWKNCDDDLDVV